MDGTTPQNDEDVDIALGSSSVKVNNVVSTKPRKKTMTSAFLKYFETADDGKSRRCKFCGQNYSIATATGNLGRHLKSRHPGYEKTTDGFVNETPASSERCNTPAVRKPLQNDHGKSPKLDLSHINWLLVKWLTSSSFPSETLEDKWLVNSFKFLNPSIQIWPCNKFRDAILEIFKTMQQDIRSTLDQVSSKVAITLEFWTSYEQIYYMGITCHWIDESWSLHKVLLDVCHIPYPCGGAEIYYALAKVLKMYNIENKVLSCTHDNSPSAMHACHVLKDDMDARKLEQCSFCYLPCASHTLNMIIEDGLTTTKAVLSKAREFALEMNSSQDISKDFVRLAAIYQEGNWKVPIDTSMRWSGHYQMLQLVCKASKSLEAVTRNHEEKLGGRMLLNLAEKNAISIVHNYLEPFYKTTNNMCTEKSPTVGLVLFFMDHITEMIVSCRESLHLPDWLKNGSEEMAKKACNYNNQVCNILTFMTSILDPRIKCELMPENLNSETNLEEARTLFIRNYSTHFSSMSTLYGSAQDNEDGGGSVSFAEEIARKKRRANMSSTSTDEFSQYLSEAPAPMPSDVLEWWKLNSSRYPRLSMMARGYLAVQATSVDPKDLFCKEGDEVEKRRFCMAKENTRTLLCIKSWSERGLKLKYKTSEVDCDRIVDLAALNHIASGDKKLKS